ncbi:hypothetical protein SAMN06264364_1531, partial [Quadrisphaera granulorum]
SAATLIFFSLGVEITGKVRPARSSTGFDYFSFELLGVADPGDDSVQVLIAKRAKTQSSGYGSNHVFMVPC